MNAEKVVADYLRDVLDDPRVVATPPSSTTTRWVMLTQLNASNPDSSEFERWGDYLFQVDCYAGRSGGHPEAVALRDAVREALVEMQRADLANVVIGRVVFTGDARIPDSEVDEPARERFALTFPNPDAARLMPGFFNANPDFEQEQNAETDWLPVANEIAELVRANAPKGGTGAYAESIEVVQTESDTYVVTKDPAGHIVEFGSVNNPAYAPLRRGAEASSLNLAVN